MSFNRTQSPLVRLAYRTLERYCAQFTHRLICVADAMSAQAVLPASPVRRSSPRSISGMRTETLHAGVYDRSAVRRAWQMGDDVVVWGHRPLFGNKGYERLIPAMAKRFAITPGCASCGSATGRSAPI